jgi:tetratricopeptide (TPR) repeat protein
MKRVLIASVALLSGGLLLAQSQQSAQKPAQGAQAAQNGPAAQQTAPEPPKGKAPPAAKSKAEVDAYNKVNTLTQQKNAAEAEKAADAFADQFKDSELRYLAYYNLMMMYQSQNNIDKAIEMGHKVLAVHPNEPITLAMVSSYISEQVRDTDMDKDERLKEAIQDAQKALQCVDTDLVVAPGITQEVVDANKAMLRSLAYAAMGNSYLVKADYANAEQNLKESVKLSPNDAVTWLRLAVTQDMQNKFKDAIASASKAVELAPAGSQQAKMAQNERQRVVQRASSALSKPAAQPAATPAAK